jgi:hypothetical protein
MTNIKDIHEKKYTGLFEIFTNFMKANGFKFDYTSTKLGLEIKEYKGIEKKRTNKGFEYVLNFIEIKKCLVEKKYIEDFDEAKDVDFVEEDKMEETNDLDKK